MPVTDETLKEVEAALEWIAHPVLCLQRQAAADGCNLDGAAAFSLAHDVGFMRGKAEAALAKLRKEMGSSTND